jgi:ornithine cyclodeaminase
MSEAGLGAPPWLGEAELRARLSYPDAVAALAQALASPATTAGTPPRQIVDTGAGQLLLMPAAIGAYAGVKVVTVAPENPAQGLPRIQGVYVLFDAATLSPRACLDAAALTELRTAAVSALAVSRLAAPDAARLVIFGAGPQARAHLEAIVAVRPVRTVTVVTRTVAKAPPLLELARRLELSADIGGPEAVAGADIVACCTTARAPVFDSSLLPVAAAVVAVGSHEPDARELDSALITRAVVVVETRRSAATAGDIVLAGGLSHVAGELADLVAGRVGPQPGRPGVFKSVGEAWEDLVVAAAAYAGAAPGPG